MYLLSNNAASTGVKYREWSALAVLKVIGFLVLEAGVYLALLWKKHKRDPLFYAVAVTLALCPFIRIGEADDSCGCRVITEQIHRNKWKYTNQDCKILQREHIFQGA